MWYNSPMNKTLLLTPALRKQVEDEVEAAFVVCEKHYKQKFPRAEIRYDIRNTNGGEAWYLRNLIRLNLTFLVENTETFLKTTVRHEVAHLVAHHVFDKKPANGKKVRPHGKEWQEVMGVVDAPAKKCHSYDVTSLDLHKKVVKRGMVTTKTKIERLLKAVSKLDSDDREYIRHAILLMLDE